MRRWGDEELGGLTGLLKRVMNVMGVTMAFPVPLSLAPVVTCQVIIPPWLHDIFLGYGDPGAAHYTGMDPALRLQTVDAKDTFLDAQHVVESFPQYEVRATSRCSPISLVTTCYTSHTFVPYSYIPLYLLLNHLPSSSQVKFEGAPPGGPPPVPPFRLTFPASGPKPLPSALSAHSRADGSSVAAPLPNAASDGSGAKEVLLVEPYVPQDPGPYPQLLPPQNKVRFTPVQVGSMESSHFRLD